MPGPTFERLLDLLREPFRVVHDHFLALEIQPYNL
jgi:hypothetical protein